MPAKSTYILITAARNEEARIDAAIKTILEQTVKPDRWLIVSDGSTDQTDSIVHRYADQHDFIELLHLKPSATRTFSSKAIAINTGYQQLKRRTHEYVGILDADVVLQNDYYENVLQHMDTEPSIGIGGGVLYDNHDGTYMPQITDINWSVSGPIQLFRKACWQDIKGYIPVRGGIDAAAEVMARMHGWQVQAFPELHVLHQRDTGSEKHSLCGIRFHRGIEDYQLGYHPVFFAARALRRWRERPFLAGAFIMLSGYVYGFIRHHERNVDDDFVRYLRKEQMMRLKQVIHKETQTSSTDIANTTDTGSE